MPPYNRQRIIKLEYQRFLGIETKRKQIRTAIMKITQYIIHYANTTKSTII